LVENLLPSGNFGFQSGRKLENIIHDSVAVIPSSLAYETFGLIFVEAFARGRTLIGARIGAISELIEESHDGFLVLSRDVSPSGKMLWRVENPQRAVEMCLSGRKKWEISFHPSDIIGIMEIYLLFVGQE
jgi:glycosyltransferase involved in cell wall biosynthesis